MPHHEDELIPTRVTLLQRLQNWQDDSSWQEFFDRYWKLIYGVARQAGLPDAEAQDIVQETMVAVARHMPKFKYDPKIGSFKAWLLNMTRWRIIDHSRKRASSANHEPFPEQETSGTSGTAMIERVVDPASNDLNEIWDKEWTQALMEAAVAKVKVRVDPQNYQLFDFYVNKEWPAEKVAATFGKSVEQVYTAKHRITEMIKEEVSRLETETT
jgi:RNA polymerase sigma factor (sigma-70 family)